MNIYEEIAMMTGRIRSYNKEKEIIASVSAVCIIKNVNEEKMLADVSLQQNGAIIRNAIIGMNVLGTQNQLKLFPSINQKGIVLISNQHPPVLIATIPNGIENFSDDTLKNGFILGDNNGCIKKYCDNNLTVKSDLSSLSIHDNKMVSISDFKNISIEPCRKYRRNKDYIKNNNVENDILKTNDQLLMKASDLLDRLDTFFSLPYNGVRHCSEELENLEKDIDKYCTPK